MASCPSPRRPRVGYARSSARAGGVRERRRLIRRCPRRRRTTTASPTSSTTTTHRGADHDDDTPPVTDPVAATTLAGRVPVDPGQRRAGSRRGRCTRWSAHRRRARRHRRRHAHDPVHARPADRRRRVPPVAQRPRPAGHVTVGAVARRPPRVPSSPPRNPTRRPSRSPSRPSPPATRSTLRIPFRLELTGSASDRISHSGDTLRLGSFVPMLAWEPGVGWAREPATAAFAEAATSPAADWTVRLDVTPGYDVLASGRRQPDGTWRATAHRDFAVSVGHFALAAGGGVAPRRQHTGRRDRGRRRRASARIPTAYLGRVLGALRDFSDALRARTRGTPSPSPSRPASRAGSSSPVTSCRAPTRSAARRRTRSPTSGSTASSASNQGRDPWLDEGLASYAEFRHEDAIDERPRS